jgi:[ribosomal protein S5]-alanine N-acetyltransferase
MAGGDVPLVLPSISTHLVSSRLQMRVAKPTDIPRIRGLILDNIDHLRPWSPSASNGVNPLSLLEMTKNILRQHADWRADRGYSLYLFERGSTETTLIGNISFTQVVRGPCQNAHVGYWIDHKQQGQGLMTEGVATCLRFAFDSLHLHRIQAAVSPKNYASLRVMAKLGFRTEGRSLRYLNIGGKWQDHDLFALTREETAHLYQPPLLG